VSRPAAANAVSSVNGMNPLKNNDHGRCLGSSEDVYIWTCAAGDQPCLSRPEARSDRICQQRDRAHWKATVAFALPVPTIVLLTNGPHLFHAPYFTSLAKPRRSACPRAHVLPTRPTTSTHFLELSHVLSITVLRRHAMRYGHCGITVETTRPRIRQDLDVPLGAHDLLTPFLRWRRRRARTAW
jgi:hypothetical protein